MSDQPTTATATVTYPAEHVTRIGLDDAKQMRSALLDAIKASRIGDRDQLLALTEPLPAWIDSDGRVMVAGWLLQTKNGVWVASFRLSVSQERSVGYAATFIKEGTVWRVIKLVPEKIRYNR